MGSSRSTIAIAHLAEALFFGVVPDDILVNILCRLDEDPRDLARLACVSTRFCKLIKTVCWKSTCEKILPLLVTELLQSTSPAIGSFPEPPGGWASLQKLLVCCPGLWHAGVLLENWDFGLDREIGWCGNFGYPDGSRLSDGSVTPEDVRSLSRLGAFTSMPIAVKCSASGSSTRRIVDNAERQDGHDDREPGLSNLSSKCTRAGMYSYGCEEGEAGVDTHGNNEGMDKGEHNKKASVKDASCNENRKGSCGTERGRHFDKEKALDCMNVEVGDEQQCQIQNTVSEARKVVAEECSVRGCENQESPMGRSDDEAFLVDAALAAMVQTADPTMMHSCPMSLNRDPLNVTTMETVCRDENEGGTDLVHMRGKQKRIAGSCMSLQEKGLHDRRPKSRQKRQRKCLQERCHVTTGPWNLSREQGNKLLANRFRADSLYICDWPGCLHPGDRRMYKLFRGVFKNFKHSHVWRNLKDMQAKATDVGCAFCVCNSTWDMVTTFCLKRSIEYHDDGEPVVRAYVCENGHVAGAWTDRPLHIL